MKTILIIGQNGQVGWELQKSLSTLGKIIALDRHQGNLGDLISLKKTIDAIHPAIIINAAAYTAVDKAESDREEAFQINAKAPAFLAEEAKRRDALFVHYSTDYVFDGSSSQPYQEDHPTKPLNVYGESKELGEKLIQQIGGKHLILRTSWVYGTRGKNFLLTILKLAKEREQLSIIHDQIGSPTWSYHLADATAKILHHCIFYPERNPWGLYHLTSSGSTSWHGFAEAIIDKSRSYHPNASFKVKELASIPTSQYPTPARRPQYSCLDLTKLHKEFGICMPSWENALDLCLRDFLPL